MDSRMYRLSYTVSLLALGGILLIIIGISSSGSSGSSRPRPSFHAHVEASSTNKSSSALLRWPSLHAPQRPAFLTAGAGDKKKKVSKVKARDTRVMFLNHHFGTVSELHAVTDLLSLRHNVSISVTESMGIYNDLWRMRVTEEEARAYRDKGNREECNPDLYDVIIVGDTIPLIRPHLEACCQMRMVAWLTTRFDWGMDWDDSWTQLVVDATSWNNFRIYPNNLLEEPYANAHGAEKAVFSDYIPGTGMVSGYWGSALEDGPQKPIPQYDDVIVVPDSVRMYDCLMKPLQDRNIEYLPFARSKYGGPFGLTNRIVVHVPYQSNTMGLFENLHQRVVYVLPSLRLFRKLGSICDARIEKVGLDELSDQDMESYVDWWRKDLQHLFFYFDDYDDLKPGSTLRKRIVMEADEKRAAIAKFMVEQREQALSVWEDALWGDWGTVDEDNDSRVGCEAT